MGVGTKSSQIHVNSERSEQAVGSETTEGGPRERRDRGWYKPDDAKIGHMKAIKHRVSKELCLAGKYGEIWVYSDEQLCALITSARIAKRLLPAKRHPILPGDEIVVRFHKSELKKWISALKIPKKREAMLKLVGGPS